MSMNPRLLRPTASGFDPRRIANLGLWLDATDTASITLNSGNVSELRDKSGNGRHYAQSTGANQPPWNTAQINGRATISFGSPRSLIGNAAALTLLRNVGGVSAAWVSTSSQAGFNVLWGVSTGTSNVSARFSIAQTSGVTPGGDVLLNTRRNDADSVKQVQYTSANQGEAAVRFAIGSLAATTLTVRQAGAQVAQDTSWLTSGNFSDTDSQASRLGASSDGSSFQPGTFGELLIWPRALTASEVSKIESWLAKKWGL